MLTLYGRPNIWEELMKDGLWGGKHVGREVGKELC